LWAILKRNCLSGDEVRHIAGMVFLVIIAGFSLICPPKKEAQCIKNQPS